MHYLTLEQKQALLMAAKASSTRNYAMILVGVEHGLRASEVCQLTAEQIRDGYITVQRLKGSRKTVQPLRAIERELLTSLAKEAAGRKDTRLFPISRVMFWKIMRKTCKAAGIPEHLAHPHILKHTCGKQAVKAGVPLPDVQTYLGHCELSSTGRYTVSDDQEACGAFAAAMGA